MARLIARSPELANARGLECIIEGREAEDIVLWEALKAWNASKKHLPASPAIEALSRRATDGRTVAPLDDIHGVQHESLSALHLVASTWGNDGDDWVGADGTSKSATGNAGNDLVFSRTISAVLNGNEGNDRLCAQNVGRAVWSMDGGSGTDDRCGGGRFATVNIETSYTSCTLLCTL